MAEADAKKSRKPGATAPADQGPDSDEAERSLARFMSIALPLGGLGGAVVVGMFAGVGSALLVVAAAALLGTIALLWASVRTLSGDAPLGLDLEAVTARKLGVDALSEQKRRVLRALKDIESEYAIGKIEQGDYDVLVARYRDEAKAVMREMDLEVAPLRSEAEKLARSFLGKRGLEPEASAPATHEEPVARDDRVTCGKCKTSNEPDAAFCKKCGGPLAEAETDAKA